MTIEKKFVVFDIHEQKTLGVFTFKEIKKTFINTLNWSGNDLDVLDLIFPNQCFNPGVKTEENYDFSKIIVRRIV